MTICVVPDLASLRERFAVLGLNVNESEFLETLLGFRLKDGAEQHMVNFLWPFIDVVHQGDKRISRIACHFASSILRRILEARRMEVSAVYLSEHVSYLRLSEAQVAWLIAQLELDYGGTNIALLVAKVEYWPQRVVFPIVVDTVLALLFQD